AERDRLLLGRNPAQSMHSGPTVTAVANGFFKQLAELMFERGQVDAVLRALRSCNARYDGREIELDHCGVVAVAAAGHAEELLRFEVSAECMDFLLCAA